MRNICLALAVLGCLTPGGTPASRADAAAESVTSSIARPESSPRAVWTQWRGAGRDGAAASGRVWPAALENLTPRWQLELGKGYSGPIVGPRHVFVVETRDTPEGERTGVRALDRDTGETAWSREWPSDGAVPFFAAANGDWVRSTPALDEARLYVGDMNEVLVALDADTGELVWRIDFPERFGTGVPDFGFASSPLIDGDALFVQAANSLVKLDSETGRVLWRKLNHDGAIQASGAFSSPIVAELGGRKQLVVQTRHELFGVDPDSGDVLWSHTVPNFRGMNIQTPVVHDDAVFTSPYRQRSFLFRIRPAGQRFGVDEVWTLPSTAYMSSPVVIDGHAYVHLGNGRLECIDLASGASRWKTEPLGRYWSMVHRDDRILALNETGTLFLIRADPSGFQLLDRRNVSDQETWAHLAVAGDEIFVRGLEEIRAWSWTAAAPTAPSR